MASAQRDAQYQRALKSRLDPLRERYTSLREHAARSPYVLEAPLLQRDGSEMGTVQVVKMSAGTFGEEDRLVLLQLLQMTSIALEHGKLFQQVQDDLLRRKEQQAVTSQFLMLLAQELQVSVAAFSKEPGKQSQRVRHLLSLLEAFPLLHDEHLTLSSAEESDLVQVAREVVREQQTLFPDAVLTVSTKVEPLFMRYAERWVRFVLSELLTYALSRPPVRKTIQVRVQEDLAHATINDALHYRTTSTEESEQLFELSYWNQQATTSQSLELGLSLSLSAAIIKRYGGGSGQNSREPISTCALCCQHCQSGNAECDAFLKTASFSPIFGNQVASFSFRLAREWALQPLPKTSMLSISLERILVTLRKGHREEANQAYVYTFELGTARNATTIAYNEPFTPPF